MPEVAVPPAASPALPLQGFTLLVVEDSRYSCEALRLIAQRLGARLRRAETMADARRHLALYRPDVVLVDLGLPDGNGAALIRDLALRAPAGPVVLGLSGDPGGRAAALAAGAAGFLDKPLPGVAGLRDLVLRHLGLRVPA
ncbi:MAG: response regulator, partial [Gemmobacter sp.]